MEAKQVADVAEAARIYLKRTHASTEMVNQATEVRLLADRKLGEHLREMEMNPGTRPSLEDGGHMKEPPSVPTLADIGITKRQSHIAQRLASIPADEFADRIAVTKAGRENLTTSKVMNPIVTRHRPASFNIDEWKKQMRHLISIRLRGVPANQRPNAINFLSELSEELSKST